MKKHIRILSAALGAVAAFSLVGMPSFAGQGGYLSSTGVGSTDFYKDEAIPEWLLIREYETVDYGNGSVVTEKLYNYDENGNLTRQGTYSDGSEPYLAERTYENGKQFRSYELKQDPAEDCYYERQYDSYGNVIMLTLYNADGIQTGIYFVYDYADPVSGRMTGDKSFSGNICTGINRYFYDEKGDCIHWISNDKYEYFYTYDNDHHMIGEEYYSDGELLWKNIYTYVTGMPVREEHYDKGTELTIYDDISYERDDNGNITKETVNQVDERGSRTYSYEGVAERDYDEYGNCIRERNYGGGKLYREVNMEYARKGSPESMGIGVSHIDISRSPMQLLGKDLEWNVSAGKSYWYENGIKQGTYSDPKGVMGDGSVRGREICDLSMTDDAGQQGVWFWLDSCYDGAKAVGKEVWVPYIYQQEAEWDEAKLREIANESDPGMADCVFDAMINKKGKWVRYDENGRMLKGWVTIEGALAELYPDQAGNTYYYDTRTGLMAKGNVTIDGKECFFDETTGALVQ